MILTEASNDSYFSIGEFVKLCRTTRATLYHYERQGLLSPIINEQNGYRFYKLYDYYIFMYVAHLIRIGFSLREIRQYIADKRLDTYLDTLRVSKSRLAEQQEQLRLRNERTQRGFRALTRAIGHPLNLPQITYREEEYFLRIPFDGNPNGKDCIRCQAEHWQYASKHGIDIQGHFLGFYSDHMPSQNPPEFKYVLTKMTEKCECEHLFSRPRGVYISMYYRGPFTEAGNAAYGIMEDYMKNHRFAALTGMFVEDIVGPFFSADPSEYIAEMSVMIE